MQLRSAEATATESQSSSCPNGETRFSGKGHKLSLTCVCIDSKDRFAFTASKDGSIVKWCLKTSKILTRIGSINKNNGGGGKEGDKHAHTRHVNCLAISHDDKFLASGGWDKKIRIWNPSDLSWMHSFTTHRQEITALAFRQGHPTLYSGSADRSVMLWSLEDDDNRCFVEALYGHESPITSMDALRKERVLSTGGRDQSIRIWKIVEQAQTVFEAKHESVDIARYVDDKTFVSSGEDGAISVWTTMKRTPLFTLPNAHRPKDSSSERPRTDGNRFDQGGLCHWVSALATFAFKEAKEKTTKATKKRKLGVDMDGDDVLVSKFEDDEEDDNEQESENELACDESGSKCNVIALVASGSCDSTVRVWRLTKKGSNHELKLHQTISCPGFVNDLRFTNDGQKLVAACGQEHRFGRWWKIKESRNCLRMFEVNKL